MAHPKVCAERTFLKGGYYGEKACEADGREAEVLTAEQVSRIILDSRRLLPSQLGNPFDFWKPARKTKFA